MDKTKLIDEELVVKHTTYTPIWQPKEVDELPENPKVNTMYNYKEKNSSQCVFYYEQLFKTNLSSQLIRNNHMSITKIVLNKQKCEKVLDILKSLDEDVQEECYLYLGSLDYINSINIGFYEDSIYVNYMYNDGEDEETVYLYKDGEWKCDPILYFDKVLSTKYDELYGCADEISELLENECFDVYCVLDNNLSKTFEDYDNMVENYVYERIQNYSNHVKLINDILYNEQISTAFNKFDMSYAFNYFDFSYKPYEWWKYKIFNVVGPVFNPDDVGYGVVLDSATVDYSSFLHSTKGVNSDMLYDLIDLFFPKLDPREQYIGSLKNSKIILNSAFYESDIEEFDFDRLFGCSFHDAYVAFNTKILMKNMLANCKKLKTVNNLYIDGVVVDGKVDSTLNKDILRFCDNLENLTCSGIYRTIFLSSEKLTDESLINIARACYKAFGKDPDEHAIRLRNNQILRTKNDIFVRFVDPNVSTTDPVSQFGPDIERCNANDERAMSLYDYLYNLKDWQVLQFY